jgi:DNA-binding beta-propeller fold protein YncE
MLSKRIATALSLIIGLAVGLGAAASPAFAETPHPFVSSFGRTPSEAFSNPNGIAVEESTGDVYVADIGTGTVYKFNASGQPVDFTAGSGAGANALTGAETEAKSFSFPEVYGTPAAIAVDNSADPSDPSRGDLYVLDAGHDVIDKFSADGEYLAQLTGPFEEGAMGLAVSVNGDLLVGVQHEKYPSEQVDLFDNASDNDFLKSIGSYVEEEPSGIPPEHGFALSPTGDYYMLFEACGCIDKLGGGELQLTTLGRVDQGPGDVAMAVDPVSGHLYVDDQAQVVELDTGGMNNYESLPDSSEDAPSAAEVSSFGSGQLEPAGSGVPRGGIAVDGVTGQIYVANPADGKVYVYSSAPPAPTAGTAANVTRTGATLQGAVDPRGLAVTSCMFEFEKTPGGEEGFPVVRVFTHSVSCAQKAEQIGSGMSPVGVSAEIGGLEPGVLYTFRLVAGNANGTSVSEGMFVTQNTGFGVKSFSVSFLNREGQPDTQAGSHPYEMVTSFAFNTVPQQLLANVDSPYRLRPVGNVKNIIIDTSPGFVGDPNATETKCTLAELDGGGASEYGGDCPPGSQVGELFVETHGYGTGNYGIYNMVPPRGVAAQLGVRVRRPNTLIDAGVLTGEQYPLQSETLNVSQLEDLYSVKATLFGVVDTGEHEEPGVSGERRKAFLTLPTGCTGPLRSAIKVDSYQDPGHFVSYHEPGQEEEGAITRNLAGMPVNLTGCAKLKFPPEIKAVPDTTDASSASGLTVDVNVPQNGAFNPEGLAESTLRDTTVALPAGVAINPSGGGGLEACSEGLAGFTGFKELNKEFEPGVQWSTFTPNAIESLQPGVSFCPDASKIGTVKIKTYLLSHELEGAVYLATQNENPFGSLISMYMLVEDPISASTVKLAGEVRLCEVAGEVIAGVSCQAPGQIITTFLNTPQLPFEQLELHFFGGERAPLATPSHCGTYTTKGIFTPWDGNAPVTSESSFNIEHGPNGGPCPGEKLPFGASFTGGATNVQAGAFTSLDGTFSRQDGEQQMARVHFTLPPGLSGLLRNVKLCSEADANAGTCGPESLIGETTVSAGVGSDPVSVIGGKVYITEKYHGAPFGLSVVDPVKAGPFDLERDTANPNQDPPCDCIVVRGKLEVNPITAAVTITTNAEAEGYAIPHFIDGIPVEIKNVNFTTIRKEFQFNPTNCEKMAISGEVESSEGQSNKVEVPFQVTNCARLAFKPGFKVSTSGHTSRANGASLHVTLAYPKAPFGSQANIGSVKVDLPRQLPSRLETLKRACFETTFDANPAACPAASRVGFAKAITPLLPVALEGPAYFISHGGAKFPELVIVLQGYGITIDLHGETFIEKGITSSTFHTVPDQPVETFELNLPEGRYSALAAPGGLCSTTKTVLVKKKVKGKNGKTHTVTRKVKKTVAAGLVMPTAFTGQNGAVIHQNTPIKVTGCAKSKKKKAGHKKRRGKK